jgi:hypothetical protein
MTMLTVNQFNFSKRDAETLEYLASEHKLEVKVYKQNNTYSVYVFENTIYSLDDRFNYCLAENVKTKKEAMQTANNFINWLDEQKGDIFGNGYNVPVKYFSFDK